MDTFYRDRVNGLSGMLLIVGLWMILPLARGETAGSFLCWRNGDVVPGALKESPAGRIGWSSPWFLDLLTVDRSVLKAIEFPRQPSQAPGCFRVSTTCGAVFTAALLSADDEFFRFHSRPLGELRLSRRVIYALDRLTHPRLFFDGSQASAWGVVAPKGPIRDLAYRVYDGSHAWPRWIEGDIPDVTRLVPMANGLFPAGYLDLGLAELTEQFALVFAGQLQAAREGDYTFQLSAQDTAKLYVDGVLLGIASTSRDVTAGARLEAGWHELRLEYGKTVEELEPRLDLKWSGPGFADLSLVGINPPPGWRRGHGGHLLTERSSSSVFRGIELPSFFELELELVSSESPRFVLGFGGDAANLALSPQPLRLETWDDEVGLVQDSFYEPVLTFVEGQRNVHLRLVFDGEAGEAKVLSPAGAVLVHVKSVKKTPGRSGIFLRNRGKDLVVRRFRIHRCPDGNVWETVDLSRPGVRLTDGRFIAGRLQVQDGVATVVDEQGARHMLDLDEVDRWVDPAAALGETATGAELVYADGTVLRGQLEEVHPDRVVLRTRFTEQPVTCSLAGAASLEFEPNAAESLPADGGGDQLLYPDGQLHGRVSFGPDELPFAWRPDGAVRAVRLGSLAGGRIERGGDPATKPPSFAVEEFPHILHLKNGEVIPCNVRSWDEALLTFRSPFVLGGGMDPGRVKAIEFRAPVLPEAKDPVANGREDWFMAMAGRQPKAAFGLDPERLERALTFPRFRRDNPPRHLLVARTGDLMRGNLLAIRGEQLEFESKGRKLTLPTARLTAVVEVSRAEVEIGGPTPGKNYGEEAVRATLTDGAVLEVEVVATGDGLLRGRSPVYGSAVIPTRNIQRLVFGDFEEEKREFWFESWVVRPAQEPEFGQGVASVNGATAEEASAGLPQIAPESARGQVAEPSRGSAVERLVEQEQITPEDPAPELSVPGLGLVRVDPRERTVRFPISINQRTGLVEYALVTDDGKTHESVFRTAAEPTHIHLGLLLLGGTPVYARELSADPLRMLPGEWLTIEVARTEAGVEVIQPLEAFVVTMNDGGTLEPGPWVFNGSMIIGNALAAQTEGSIVSLQLDPAALINNPRPGRANDELHRANPEALPADDVGWEMVIRLTRDQKRAASGEEPQRRELVNPGDHDDVP